MPGRGRDGLELDGPEAGFEEIGESDIMSEGSFASAESQGYRTEEEGTLTFEVSMIRLGWQNEELISDRWVKIADQPEVRVMRLTEQGEPLEREDEGCVKVGDRETKTKTVYCVTGLPISKQQELAEASFQLSALSQQEVPDYFAGPAMAKTVTQESRVVQNRQSGRKRSWRSWNLLQNWGFTRLSR